MAPSKLRFAVALARTELGRSGTPRPNAARAGGRGRHHGALELASDPDGVFAGTDRGGRHHGRDQDAQSDCPDQCPAGPRHVGSAIAATRCDHYLHLSRLRGSQADGGFSRRASYQRLHAHRPGNLGCWRPAAQALWLGIGWEDASSVVR